MKKSDKSIIGVEACDLQAGDVIKASCGKKLNVSCVSNMSGRTFVSFYNASEVSFRQDDRLDVERYIYA